MVQKPKFFRKSTKIKQKSSQVAPLLCDHAPRRDVFSVLPSPFPFAPTKIVPMVDLALRTLLLCLALAGAETLHSIARTVWGVPRIGKERAIKLSALTGSGLALVICYWLEPPMQLQSMEAHGLLGLLLATFMAAFDLAIGRWVMRKAWHKLWPDFNPATGNYLLYGLFSVRRAAAGACLVPLMLSWGFDGLVETHKPAAPKIQCNSL